MLILGEQGEIVHVLDFGLPVSVFYSLQVAR